MSIEWRCRWLELRLAELNRQEQYYSSRLQALTAHRRRQINPPDLRSPRQGATGPVNPVIVGALPGTSNAAASRLALTSPTDTVRAASSPTLLSASVPTGASDVAPGGAPPVAAAMTTPTDAPAVACAAIDTPSLLHGCARTGLPFRGTGHVAGQRNKRILWRVAREKLSSAAVAVPPEMGGTGDVAPSSTGGGTPQQQQQSAQPQHQPQQQPSQQQQQQQQQHHQVSPSETMEDFFRMHPLFSRYGECTEDQMMALKSHHLYDVVLESPSVALVHTVSALHRMQHTHAPLSRVSQVTAALDLVRSQSLPRAPPQLFHCSSGLHLH